MDFLDFIFNVYNRSTPDSVLKDGCMLIIKIASHDKRGIITSEEFYNALILVIALFFNKEMINPPGLPLEEIGLNELEILKTSLCRVFC